jgi:hypothetical protein
MFKKYILEGDMDSPEAKMIAEWANEPTMICLNGGASKNLRDTQAFFAIESNPYPWAMFNEDKDSLEGIMTNICILVPPKIYEAYVELVRGQEYNGAHGKIKFRSMCDLYCATGWSYDVRDTLTAYGEKHGSELTVFDCELIDFLRGFRLAS